MILPEAAGLAFHAQFKQSKNARQGNQKRTLRLLVVPITALKSKLDRLMGLICPVGQSFQRQYPSKY